MRAWLSMALCAGVLGAAGNAAATTYVDNVTMTLTTDVPNTAYGDVKFTPVTFGPSDQLILNVTFDKPMILYSTVVPFFNFIVEETDAPNFPHDIIPGTSGLGRIGYGLLSWSVSGYSVDIFETPGKFTPDARASVDETYLQFQVPEPSTWALMVGGFGLAGAALRRQRLGLRSDSRSVLGR